MRSPILRKIMARTNAIGEKLYGGECMSFRQIANLFWPLFIDQLFLQGINVINTVMIASYGPEAISAVSLVGSFTMFVTSVFIAIATGCAVVVAQYCGKRERHNASDAAAQALISTLIITMVISALLYIFTDVIIELLLGKAEPLTKEYCRVFFKGNVVSFPLFGIMQTVLSALRGSGNTKASVFFSTGINALYVLLNVVFLFVFRLGIYGLSISTIISRAIFTAISVLYMMYPKNILYVSPRSFIKIDWKFQRSILYIAIPTALEQVFFHGGRILTQVFIVGFGTMSTTANAVVTTLNQLLMVTGQTISIAILTIAGQCIGMGNVSEAKRYIKLSTFTGIVACALTSLITLPLLRPLLMIYNLPGEAYSLAYGVSLMLLIGTPLTWCISFITPSGLRAGGDATYSTVVSLICMWGIRVGLGYMLGVLMGTGLYGVWIAMFSEWAVRGVIFLIRAGGSKWHMHSVISEQ